jgi:hypothetical protein
MEKRFVLLKIAKPIPSKAKESQNTRGEINSVTLGQNQIFRK